MLLSAILGSSATPITFSPLIPVDFRVYESKNQILKGVAEPYTAYLVSTMTGAFASNNN